jgi:putative MATE family efflux protein
MAKRKIEGDKFTRMTTAPLRSLITSLAIPSMVIMVVSALYNIADTFFVSFLGTSVVAAVGIGFPLMGVIQAVGFFFGAGSGNYMSRALGSKQTDEAARMAATGLVSGFLFMAAISVACLITLKPLVIGLGATPTITPYAEKYIFYILFAAPWMVSATVLNMQLRFEGSAAIAMTGMLSGAVLNIFLDPLFIIVVGLGISGAAIATMLSQMISFSILFFYGTTRGENIRIKFRLFSPSVKRYREILRGGIPSLLRQVLLAISTVIINHFAGIYGDAAIAAISIVQRLMQFAGSLALGFGQGFQPVCGFNYGAKLYERVRKGFWFCWRTSSGIMLVMAIGLAVFAPQVIAFFRKDDPEVMRIGVFYLRLVCLTMPLVPWVVTNNMTTQTIGLASYASFLAVARCGLFTIPALIIFRLCGLGLTGVLISMPVSDFCAFLSAIPVAYQLFTKILS